MTLLSKSSSFQHTALEVQRLNGAKASQGVSIDSVYRVFDRLVTEAGLGGATLDYGAGNGFGVKRLLGDSRLSTLTATDLMPRPLALDPKVNWVQGDLNEKSSFADESFDLIYSFEVIEHLENPRFQAREFFRLLRPNGTLVVSSPNNESLRALGCLWRRGHFVCFGPLDYPAHQTALLRVDFSRVLSEAGFESPQFFFGNQGSVPLMTSRTWQELSAGLLTGLRFSDHLVVLARKSPTGSGRKP